MSQLKVSRHINQSKITSMSDGHGAVWSSYNGLILWMNLICRQTCANNDVSMNLFGRDFYFRQYDDIYYDAHLQWRHWCVKNRGNEVHSKRSICCEYEASVIRNQRNYRADIRSQSISLHCDSKASNCAVLPVSACRCLTPIRRPNDIEDQRWRIRFA